MRFHRSFSIKSYEGRTKAKKKKRNTKQDVNAYKYKIFTKRAVNSINDFVVV